MSLPVVIVGGSLGGLRTAEAIRRNGYVGPIRVIGAEKHPPYNRPPLSKSVLSSDDGIEELLFPIKEFLKDVEWVLGVSGAKLDISKRVVVDSEGNEHPYSAVVIATGLRPKPLPVETHGLAGIHVLRSFEDATALRRELQPGAKVLILGAGFIGCEVAATAAKAGCQVKVVSRTHEPIADALGAELSAAIKQEHLKHRVEFIKGGTVFGLIGDGRIERTIIDTGVIYDTDVLVVAIGTLPNTEWLEDSTLDVSDGVLVNNFMQAIDTRGAVVPGVFSVGDVARYANPLYDDIPRRVEHWNLPSEMAKRAGQTLVAGLSGGLSEGIETSEFAPLPSFWSDQYDMHILALGMPYLATHSRIVENDGEGQLLVEYFRQDKLIGVCGIGFRSKVQAYRQVLGSKNP